MYATLTYKCRECGRRCSFPLLDELDEIQTTTVVMDILEEPICGSCEMAKATFDDWEDERSPRFWFEGPGGGACACGSYSCDGGCDSYAMYRQQEKELAEFYAHLAPDGYRTVRCGDPDCRCARWIIIDHEGDQYVLDTEDVCFGEQLSNIQRAVADQAIAELRGLDPDNYEDMAGQYVEGYNPFSFEGFMAGETVEHVLYMKDTQEVVEGSFRVVGEDGGEIPF